MTDLVEQDSARSATPVTERLAQLLRAVGEARTPAVYPTDEEHRAAQQRHWQIQRWIAGGALALAALAALFTLLALSAATKTADQARRQAAALQSELDMVRAEQRPWIKVEPDRVASLQVLRYPDPGKVDAQADAAVLNIAFRINNVGHSPAFGLRLFLWSFVPTKQQANPAAVQRERCQQIREVGEGPGSRGDVVFPGDRLLSTQLAGDGRVVVPISFASLAQARQFAGGNPVPLYVIGCADYALRQDGKDRHQTGIVLAVEHLVHVAGGMGVENGFSFRDSVPGPDIVLSTEYASGAD